MPGKELSPKMALALRVLLAGDAYVEGGSSTFDHGRVINVATARVLEEHGLIETYEDPTRRISPPWKARITEAGRQAVTEVQHNDGRSS